MAAIKKDGERKWRTTSAVFSVTARGGFYRVTWHFDSVGRPTEIKVDDCYASFDKFSVDNRDGRHCPCPTCAYVLARECFLAHKPVGNSHGFKIRANDDPAAPSPA